MTISVVPSDVKDIYPTSLPDSVLQSMINSAIVKFGECLDNNYDDDTANLIVTYYVAWLAQDSDGGELQSERAANGASVTYKTADSGDGLKSNAYGRTLMTLDSFGCVQNSLYVPFGICTVGKCS